MVFMILLWIIIYKLICFHTQLLGSDLLFVLLQNNGWCDIAQKRHMLGISNLCWPALAISLSIPLSSFILSYFSYKEQCLSKEHPPVSCQFQSSYSGTKNCQMCASPAVAESGVRWWSTIEKMALSLHEIECVRPNIICYYHSYYIFYMDMHLLNMHIATGALYYSNKLLHNVIMCL